MRGEAVGEGLVDGVDAELCVIGVDGAALACGGGGDVDDEGGVGDVAEVGAVVVEDPLGIEGRAEGGEARRDGHVDFGEFGVEAGVLGDAGDGEVVGVGVVGVGHEEDGGLVGADDAGDGVAGLGGVLDAAVGEVEQDALDGLAVGVGRGEVRERGGGFGEAGGAVAVGRGAAVGHVDEEDVVALVGEEGDGAAHADFLIVGVWADDEDVHGCGGGEGMIRGAAFVIRHSWKRVMSSGAVGG